jgi:hypothetical protein
MTLLFPQLADVIGIISHLIAGCASLYLCYWCWQAWKYTGSSTARAFAWLCALLAALSFLLIAGSFCNGYASDVIIELRTWTRIGFGVTMALAAWKIYKLGGA